MPAPLPPEWKPLLASCPATDDEMCSMLYDLHAACGSWSTVAWLVGFPHSTVKHLAFKGGHGSIASRRSVWLTWALICRPGRIQTALHLATWGRITADGGPESAGRKLDSGHRRARWLLRYDQEMRIRCDLVEPEQPPEDWSI